MKQIHAYLGTFGKYQAFLYLLCVTPAFLGGSTTLVYNWVGHMPDVRCRLVDVEAGNSTEFNLISRHNLTHRYVDDSLCFYCPPNVTKCTKAEALHCAGHDVVIDAKTIIVPNSLAIRHWTFCANVWRQRLIWTLNAVGFGFGAALFGMCSDRFGRRKTFLAGAVAFFLLSHGIAFADDYYVYAVLQLAIGFVQHGCYITMFTIFVELVDDLPRVIGGILYQAIFGIGVWVGSQDWHMIQYLAGAPSVILLSYFFLLPESIRWLMVNGRAEEARKAIERAARMNNVVIPAHIIDEELNAVSAAANHKSPSVLALFTHWRLAKNTTIMFATSMGSFGLIQNAVDLPADPFLTFVLMSAAVAPGYLLAILLMHFWGRRPALMASLAVGGVGCILGGLARTDWIVVASAVTGQMGLTAAFAIIFNYSAELFPTVLRQTGTGYASVCARMGSVLAPQIRLLGDYTNPSTPIIVYGSAACLAAILAVFLPETRNRELPETIEDGWRFGKTGAEAEGEKRVERMPLKG